MARSSYSVCGSLLGQASYLRSICRTNMDMRLLIFQIDAQTILNINQVSHLKAIHSKALET